MDRNHDGVVTMDEFLECCRCDQAITNSMLVFDSTIWWYDDADTDGYQSNALKPSGNQNEATTSVVIHNQNTNHSNFQYHPNAKQHQQQHNGGGSKTSQTISHDIRSHKNSSSSFSKNSTNSHRSASQQHFHAHQTTVIGNKMRNNTGHKVSQTKRIQLSTAAKRCKSMETSNAVDNNSNSHKVINHDDICKADDDCADNNEDDDNSRQMKDNLSGNNSTQTQSTASPTLVRVKMWQTESRVILPHQHMAWYYFDVDLWRISIAFL